MTYRVSDNTKRRFSDMIWHIGGIAILGLLVAVWGRLHGPWSEGQKAEQIQELGSHFAPIEAVQRIEGAVKTMAESVESMDEKHDQWYHEFEEKRSNFITKTNTAIQNLQASQTITLKTTTVIILSLRWSALKPMNEISPSCRISLLPSTWSSPI